MKIAKEKIEALAGHYHKTQHMGWQKARSKAERILGTNPGAEPVNDNMMKFFKKTGLPIPDAVIKIPNECFEEHPQVSNEVAGGHYDLPHCVKETIDLIEIVMQRENIPPCARFHISQAIRYIMRCGIKTDDYRKDVAKAENYLHRALTGEWIAK